MSLRFSKVPAAEMVDAHFTADDPRVTVKPEEFPRPIYPEDEGFWGEFSTVIDEVGDAKNNSRRESGVAECFERAGLSRAAACAKAVHKDWPTDLSLLIAKDVKGGYRDLGLTGQFTDGVVLLNYLMAAAAWRVSANSFCAKAHFMMPRPEEVAGAITRGDLECPPAIMARLKDLPGWKEVPEDQRKFTMYAEGSPNHASFNAMHSAAAAAGGTIIKVLRELNEDERSEVDLGIINIGMWRTTAGVHYPQDNYAGFWLGQLTVERFVVDELVSIGADRGKVEAALSDANTDWIAGSGLKF